VNEQFISEKPVSPFPAWIEHGFAMLLPAFCAFSLFLSFLCFFLENLFSSLAKLQNRCIVVYTDQTKPSFIPEILENLNLIRPIRMFYDAIAPKEFFHAQKNFQKLANVLNLIKRLFFIQELPLRMLSLPRDFWHRELLSRKRKLTKFSFNLM
jgi:hypothetical protein